MTGKEKRPPILVEELIEKKRVERSQAEQGELTYVANRGLEPPKEVEIQIRGFRGRLKRELRGSSMKLILPIVISVVLAAIMLVQFAPSKATIGALGSEIEGTKESLSVLGTQLTYESGRIDNIVGQMGTYVKSGELASLKEELTSLNSKIADTSTELSRLQGLFTSLTTRLAALEVKETSLESRVSNLED